MVAAVASNDARKVIAKANTLCHMREKRALLGLLLLNVLSHRVDDLVQRALRCVAEASMCFADIWDSVFHVFKALAICLRIGYVANGTLRTSGPNDLLGKSLNRDLFRAPEIEDFAYSSGRSDTRKDPFNDIVNMPETAGLPAGTENCHRLV